ncbi:hypothetical protein MUK42_37736, partial [Musa troglodytarum]
ASRIGGPIYIISDEWARGVPAIQLVIRRREGVASPSLPFRPVHLHASELRSPPATRNGSVVWNSNLRCGSRCRFMLKF